MNKKGRIYDEALFEIRRGPVVFAVLRPGRWDWLRVALIVSDVENWLACVCVSFPGLRLKDRGYNAITAFRAGRLNADRRTSAVHLLWLHVVGRSFTEEAQDV